MQVSQQMDVFKKSLEEFAMKYKNEIKKNPEFRLVLLAKAKNSKTSIYQA